MKHLNPLVPALRVAASEGLTAEEAAKTLDVGLSHVYRLAESYLIPFESQRTRKRSMERCQRGLLGRS